MVARALVGLDELENLRLLLPRRPSIPQRCPSERAPLCHDDPHLLRPSPTFWAQVVRVDSSMRYQPPFVWIWREAMRILDIERPICQSFLFKRQGECPLSQVSNSQRWRGDMYFPGIVGGIYAPFPYPFFFWRIVWWLIVR